MKGALFTSLRKTIVALADSTSQPSSVLVVHERILEGNQQLANLRHTQKLTVVRESIRRIVTENHAFKYHFGISDKFNEDILRCPGVLRRETYYDTSNFENLRSGMYIRKLSIAGKEDTWSFKWSTDKQGCVSLYKELEFSESELPEELDLSNLEVLAVICTMRFEINKTVYVDVCCIDVDDFYVVATENVSNDTDVSLDLDVQFPVNSKLFEYLTYHLDHIYVHQRDELLNAIKTQLEPRLDPKMHTTTPLFRQAAQLDTGMNETQKYNFKVNREIELSHK